MTNSPDPELARLEAALTEVFAAPVPNLAFEAPWPLSEAHRPGLLRRHWRPAGALVGIAAAIGAFLLVPSFGGDSSTVNAQDILDRAEQTASSFSPSSGTTSYHLVATWGGDKGASTTEIWFRDSGHVRSSFGDEFGTVINGDEVWMYMSTGSTLRVAHGPAEALAEFVGQAAPTGNGLASVLAQYGDESCQQATLSGDGTVAGRDAYIVRVSPAPESCPGDIKAQAMAEYAGFQVISVDKETFITLKVEAGDGSGLTTSYVVTLLDTGRAIPDEVFDYSPPAGAIVTEVASNTEAKNAISGIDAGSSGKPSTEDAKEPNVELSKP